MAELKTQEYDIVRIWITNMRAKDKSWEDLELACKKTEDKLRDFLESHEEEDGWPALTNDEWKELVRLEKEAAEQTIVVEENNGLATITGDGEQNAVRVPIMVSSAWKCYEKGLLSTGWSNTAVKSIELASLRILKNLSSNTVGKDAIKGLVIGNVQSGKTANMAGLMAMAADHGWNMFIILSGTIDNLRKQTQERLFNDLNKENCNLHWVSLEHLKKKAPIGQRTQDLHFGDTSPQRYFSVCLKNGSRLKNLIQWLQSDKGKQQQMKVLIIDDEADQAGINTANINSHERKTINRHICNMVNGNNENGEKAAVPYMAMNYIGYTATPYANVLNESGKDSLYPSNFISTLSVSKEYFGPQQIFGLEGETDGLDIVREVPTEDVGLVKAIHSGTSTIIPESLEKSLCWFFCGVACMRYWGYKKPISMLVHTSQMTDHHQSLASAIAIWRENHEVDEIVKLCGDLWKTEKNQFSLKKFREQYPDYGIDFSKINDYPKFQDLEANVRELLTITDLSFIKLDEEGELTYHKGLHLCIDNCKNNAIEDDSYVRLAYPDKTNKPDFAPAFIVIGGATLSRGLTIEGLISTYFLRSVNQADSLMQMGRWFGYRKGYELIPRLWITQRTREQFEFLSQLDEELRTEIHQMAVLGQSPAHYGPRVMNSPKYSFIRIVAKNKMQAAEPSEMNYCGAFHQTYLFDNDKDILEANLASTEEFINKLGTPILHKEVNKHAKHTVIWKGVDFSDVESYLNTYKFNERLTTLNDIGNLLEWIKKMTSDDKLGKWNVVLAGKDEKDKSGEWSTSNCHVSKVNRTRKILDKSEDKIINIGTLRTIKDVLADIDLEYVDEDLKNKVLSATSKYARELRNKAGLTTIPQLLIYIVDKDSKAKTGSETRTDLNVPCDLAGLCINIPGGKEGTQYVASIAIKMPAENAFDDQGDIDTEN